jgi:Holliday junction resolvase
MVNIQRYFCRVDDKDYMDIINGKEGGFLGFDVTSECDDPVFIDIEDVRALIAQLQDYVESYKNMRSRK